MQKKLYIILFLVISLITILASTALATLIQDMYAGRVIVLDKLPPSSWPDNRWIVKFIKQHSTTKVDENQDKNWNVHFMAFFRKAIDARQVTVIFNDINDGNERFIQSYDMMLYDTAQRIVGDTQLLSRPAFRPNRYYNIVITAKRTKIASISRFVLIGSEPKRTGEVIFTDEETHGR